jgi:hypothetical protein
MPLNYGASHNLEKLVQTHLFVICPNNSGSTFLKKALATSRHTWNLAREGQHTFGYAGPSSIDNRLHRHWACNDESIEVFRNPSTYDWELTRRAWYFQAYSLSDCASIFVEKSPPFVLIVDELARNFSDARFIFMVRDPYAMVEGLLRKGNRRLPAGPRLQIAATHVMNCLSYQRRNIEVWSSRGTFFTYETMCEEPARAERLIKNLAPALTDLTLRQRIQVWEYNEELRNMNEQQIARLGKDDVNRINEVFSLHRDLFDYFHYPFRS